MLTYANLRTPEGQAVIAARIRQYLTDGGLPVASWAPAPVGLENLRIEAVAGAVAALMDKRVAAIARGRNLATATDVSVADGGDGPWLSYLGQEVYRLAKRGKTKTVKWVALYSTAGATQPALNFQPGDLIVRSTVTGNQYRNVDAGTLTGANTAPVLSYAGAALALRFEAEEAGASYADAASTLTEMVTARAGVQCVNIRPVQFEEAIVLGTSGGRVAGAFTNPIGVGVPPYGSVVVRIDASGDVGGGLWSYLIPGAGWVSGGPLAPSTFLPGGTTVLMTDGAVSPSFRAGDLFVLLVGSDTATQGADDESDAHFAQMCRNRHTQVTRVPLAGALELLARAASDEVERVVVDADPDTPGLVVLTLASAVGPASPGACKAVQAFVAARLMGYQGVGASAVAIAPEERAVAVSATTFPVTASGVVYCSRDVMAQVKVAADRAWIRYLGSVPIGGDRDAVVRLAELEQAIADAGADDVDDAALNGVAANLTVPAGQVAVVAPATSLATSMTWVGT